MAGLDDIRLEDDDVDWGQSLRLHNLDKVEPIRTYHNKKGALTHLMCHKQLMGGVHELHLYHVSQFTVPPKIVVLR